MLTNPAGTQRSRPPGGPSTAKPNFQGFAALVASAWRVPLFLLLSAFSLAAQPGQPVQPPPPAPQRPRDPLMTLMLSQPSIDVDSPVVATAGFDPPVIGPGQDTTYRVSFNALEASIEWPGTPSTTPRMDLRASAHGQMLQLAGSVFQPRTSFNYHFRTNTPGQFTVPEFTVTVYGKPVKVPAAELQVAADVPPPQRPPPRLFLEMPTHDIYVGQPLRVRVQLPGSGGAIQALTQVQLSGDVHAFEITPLKLHGLSTKGCGLS